MEATVEHIMLRFHQVEAVALVQLVVVPPPLARSQMVREAMVYNLLLQELQPIMQVVAVLALSRFKVAGASQVVLAEEALVGQVAAEVFQTPAVVVAVLAPAGLADLA